MSSNVGLSTPRGSGTSGYVQRNLSQLRPPPQTAGRATPYSASAGAPPRTRKPDQEILRHDRLRAIEVQVLEYRDSLEDADNDDDAAIDDLCDAYRARLVDEMDSAARAKKKTTTTTTATGAKPIKGYQVHELAEAKAVESERLRRALGLRGRAAGGGGGGAGPNADVDADEAEHPMARQERQRREREADRANRELEREERQAREVREHSRVGV